MLSEYTFQIPSATDQRLSLSVVVSHGVLSCVEVGVLFSPLFVLECWFLCRKGFNFLAFLSEITGSEIICWP